MAPCAGYITKEEYNKIIKQIIDILSGTDKTIINDLKKEMKELSMNLEFEKAAIVRDKITALEALIEKQKIFKALETDEDFINIYRVDSDVCIQVFFMRDGKISGREHFIIEQAEFEEDETILSQFIVRFYSGTAKVPKNIYVPCIEDLEILEEFLSIKRDSKAYFYQNYKLQYNPYMHILKYLKKVIS